MTSALIIFYVLIALTLIILVLLQDPKGGGGALFGGGGSQSLFGATGATSFIVKATRVIAILFALCVIGLNYTLMGGNSSSTLSNDIELSEPVLGGGATESDDIEAQTEEMAEEVESEEKTEDNSQGEEK